MRLFLNGAFTALALVVSLFFARFYAKTRDRLFIMFSCAFFLLGFERIAVSSLDINNERVNLVTLIRLFSLVMILAAIVDKNRRGLQD